MADESKTGNQRRFERQDAQIEGADETLDAELNADDYRPGSINVKKEEANVAEIAAKAADTGKKKKKRNLWGSVTNRHKNMIKKEEKAAKVAADAEAADLAAKAVAKKAAQAEKKAREIQEKVNLQAKEYEQDKAKLQLKINIYIEEIGVLEQGFAEKLNANKEEVINELITTELKEGDVLSSLKIKLSECLKQLGSIMNLRESKQIDRINAYIKNLKEANDIFKINQYLTEDNKLDENIDFEDKKCEPQDSIEECQTKLTDALALFETFKGNMKKAYEEQGANEDKFKQLGTKVADFKKEFEKWMGQLDQLGGENPIDKLETLKGTIKDYDVNQDLLGDEKDLKSNMVEEIEILIKAITEFKQYEDELKEAKKNAEAAKVELDALKEAETAQQVAAAAAKEEEKKPEEFRLGETGIDVEQHGQKDKDGGEDGQPVVAKTDKPETEVSDDGGASSEVETALENPLPIEEQSNDPLTSGDTVGTDSPPNIISETPKEEGVADVAVPEESEEEKTARLAKEKRHEEIKKLKEKQLPEGLERSQSEVVPSGEEGGIKRADSSPGKIGPSTKDKPTSIVEKEVKRKEEIIAQQKEAGVNPTVSPEKGEVREEVTKVDAKGKTKEIPELVGGRKKKSRRRKKSKKRKSKKNRR